jgi:hypothetical protein
MIRCRAAAAGIETKIGNHTFQATGITGYLENGDALEKAGRWRPATEIFLHGDLESGL